MRWIAAFVGLSTIAAIDFIFKQQSLTKLPYRGSFVDTSWFRFGLHKNEGIAFNISIDQTVIIFLSMVAVLVLVWVIVSYVRSYPKTSFWSLVLLAGTLGNLGDRLVWGYVVDYLIFFERTAINLSDLLICLGVTGLLLTQKASNVDIHKKID